MKRILSIVLTFCAGAIVSYAQEQTTVLDTLFVVSKSITTRSEVNTGAKIEQIPIELL